MYRLTGRGQILLGAVIGEEPEGRATEEEVIL
jgi:hypothetical protein